MTAPSWAGPIRTVDGRDEVLVPCDTCGGPVYESCRTRWRERGRRDCGVFCDFLGVAANQPDDAVQPATGPTPDVLEQPLPGASSVPQLQTTTPRPGDGTDSRSGWCGRDAHHRCIGAYDVVCDCSCHAHDHTHRVAIVTG